MFGGEWAWWEVFLWRFVEPLPLQVFPLRETDYDDDDDIGELRIMTRELA